MLLMWCKDEAWKALQYRHNAVEACAGAHLLLCRQFELARAVREGVRPSAVREVERGIHPMLHEFFAGVKGIAFRKAPVSRCDVCQLIDAMKRVACSQYSREYALFLEETRDDEGARLSYDLTGVFQTYIDAVGPTGGEWNAEQMHRAVAIMQKVRTLLLAGKNVSTTPVSVSCLEETATALASLRDRIASLGQPQLRVVR